jgi:hypothetical protein
MKHYVNGIPMGRSQRMCVKSPCRKDGERMNDRCRVPDDCIDSCRRALFVGREALIDFIESLRSQAS